MTEFDPLEAGNTGHRMKFLSDHFAETARRFQSEWSHGNRQLTPQESHWIEYLQEYAATLLAYAERAQTIAYGGELRP
jgi:hypothetical protein